MILSEEKELRATINFNKILLIFELFFFFSSSIFSLIHAVAILAQAMAVVGFNVEASAQLEEDGSVVAGGNKLYGGDSSRRRRVATNANCFRSDSPCSQLLYPPRGGAEGTWLNTRMSGLRCGT